MARSLGYSAEKNMHMKIQSDTSQDLLSLPLALRKPNNDRVAFLRRDLEVWLERNGSCVQFPNVH